MYRPDLFRVDDLPRLHALMRAQPFAALISAGADGLFATHLPTVLKDDGPFGTIECHVARANPHWKTLGDEVLMIFQGPEGYITPNWYPSKAEHGKVVPTWNYATVHVKGHIRFIEDPEWLRSLVESLTDEHERHSVNPWKVTDAPADYIAGMVRAIVGFEIQVSAIEGKFKASQNRSAADRAGVAAALRAAGLPSDAVAQLAPESGS
jgi:transcriptional regulator